MGYFFENMEKMYIQAEREAAQRERENAQRERENAQRERENAQRERENAQRERENAQRERERADSEKIRADTAEARMDEEKARANIAEQQLLQALIAKVSQIQKKYHKGKTLDQAAYELEEEPDAIRQIYEAVSRNPEKSAEAIADLIW